MAADWSEVELMAGLVSRQAHPSVDLADPVRAVQVECTRLFRFFTALLAPK